ncbi:hypothetical protein [Kitasatospora sp. NPDC050543]|uniref:hypothetical protein n=1 Tax=Kitasatospora sp. NPDC050543 TaxID=3364054 RepID=UPI00379CA9A9
MSAVRRRLPDEVRAAAIRAWMCLSCTLVSLMLATLASYAGSWLLTPALMVVALGVFGTTWSLLEIMISRQIAAQRRRGPNSASPMAGSQADGSQADGSQATGGLGRIAPPRGPLRPGGERAAARPTRDLWV